MSILISGAPGAFPAGWKALFDGKTLNGWKANENPETFKVMDGMIVAEGKKSHLFYTGSVQNAEFKNFELKADFKTEPEANSGIYFHAAFNYSNFPQKGYEVQIANGSGVGPTTGSLYNVVDFSDSPVHHGEWFTIHIIVKDTKVITKVNDKLRLEYDEKTDPNAVGRKSPKISSGTFAIQNWNPKSRFYVKNIFVKPLP